MTIRTTTHLNFRGSARDALGFYQAVFGGALTVVTYGDAQAVTEPSEAGQVIWGQVVNGDGFHVMAFDVPSARPWDPGVMPVFVSVRGNDPAQITGYWEKLSDGGTVLQPIGPAGFSPLYGMVRDRFGVTWVLDVEVAYPDLRPGDDDGS